MKDKLRLWYDAAHNKTEINDAYLQGMWNEAMLAVRTMGQEISTLETEQIMLGSRIVELDAENAKLREALRARRWEVGVRVCDICRFEEPSHAPWCPAGRKPMEPDEDHIKRRFDKQAQICFEKEMEALRKENTKLRALVERGGKLDVFNPQKGGLLKFAEDCREALK